MNKSITLWTCLRAIVFWLLRDNKLIIVMKQKVGTTCSGFTYARHETENFLQL